MRYTLHAVERMKQRGISLKDAESCLNNPEKIIESSESRCIKKLDDRALVVVFRREGEAVIVITAYYTSKLLHIPTIRP